MNRTDPDGLADLPVFRSYRHLFSYVAKQDAPTQAILQNPKKCIGMLANKSADDANRASKIYSDLAQGGSPQFATASAVATGVSLVFRTVAVVSGDGGSTQLIKEAGKEITKQVVNKTIDRVVPEVVSKALMNGPASSQTKRILVEQTTRNSKQSVSNRIDKVVNSDEVPVEDRNRNERRRSK